MRDLTPRQLEALRAIDRLSLKVPCTMREVSSYFGIDFNAAYDHLRALRRKGMVTWVAGKSRTLRITSAGTQRLHGLPSSRFIPIVHCERCSAARAGKGPCPACAREAVHG